MRRAALALYKRALRASQNCPDSIMRRKVSLEMICYELDVFKHKRGFRNKSNADRCKTNRMAPK